MIRKILWLLATLHLAQVHLAEAQQPKKMTRVGFLSPYSGSAAIATRVSALPQNIKKRYSKSFGRWGPMLPRSGKGPVSG